MEVVLCDQLRNILFLKISVLGFFDVMYVTILKSSTHLKQALGAFIFPVCHTVVSESTFGRY